MALKVRVGTVPILWNNDDVPELTPPVPFERVIDEMARAGYEGTELGSNYPRDPAVLRQGLGRAGLQLSGGYFCDDFTVPANHREVFQKAEKLAGFLAESGAGYLVVADKIHPERSAVAGRARAEHAHSFSQFGAFVDAMHQLARIARKAGLEMVFHNHCGTYVETPEELDRLMGATDSTVGLCLDTGHYLLGGGKPAEAVRKYKARLRYVHLKDVGEEAYGRAIEAKVSFLDFLRRRIFTELGRGMLDLGGVLSALNEIQYSGWLVVEQDTNTRPPLESAATSRENLRKALAEIG